MPTDRPRVRPLPGALALACMILLLLVVAWPDAWAINRAVVRIYVIGLNNGVPASITPEHWGAALNVLLFVPATALVALALPRLDKRWVLAGAVGLTVTIELAQAASGGARQADVLDVVSNAAGALVGIGLAQLVERRWS